MSGVTIKELPAGERPREKMMSGGAEKLSNAELLAILLRTGTARESALHLAERLLAACGGLAGLGAAAPGDFSAMKGIGTAKAVTLMAAIELGKRLTGIDAADRPIIRTPDDAARLLMQRLRYEKKEQFLIMVLSTKNHVLAIRNLSVGILNSCIVHPREVFREAASLNAAAIILVHNHPSGDPTPSPEDIALTRRMAEAGRLMDLPVLDHLIIGDGKYVSLKEKGII